jgi:hypothetical protein
MDPTAERLNDLGEPDAGKPPVRFDEGRPQPSTLRGQGRGMSMPLPTYFLMVVFAGWVNRQQRAAIEYLKAENEILKAQLQGHRYG